MKRQNETRNRSLISQNAFPPRETDQNFRKTPSRGGKWGKFSEKRLPAAGNGKNSQKNGFPRRERGKIARKTVSCGGKAVKFAGDRFPAAGKGANSPKNAFRRAKSIFKKPPSPPREDIESPPGACLIRYPMRGRTALSLPGRAQPLAPLVRVAKDGRAWMFAPGAAWAIGLGWTTSDRKMTDRTR